MASSFGFCVDKEIKLSDSRESMTPGNRMARNGKKYQHGSGRLITPAGARKSEPTHNFNYKGAAQRASLIPTSTKWPQSLFLQTTGEYSDPIGDRWLIFPALPLPSVSVPFLCLASSMVPSPAQYARRPRCLTHTAMPPLSSARKMYVQEIITLLSIPD